MFRNNNQSWIPIFSCSLLSVIGIFISLCLILSLIPLYLNNRSVEKSDATYPVYTVNNVPFTIGSGTGRPIRDTDSTSYEPTSTMIDSIAKQLYDLFSKIDCRVVVSGATMSSKTKLILTLKVYFLRGCFACQKAEKKLIKRILKEGLTLSIYTEYYQNCIFNAITLGTTFITLYNDINDDKISPPKETLIKTLVQQTNICGTSLAYPTDCNRTEASGNVTTIAVSNTVVNFQSYCYYFVPSIFAKNIKVQFIFTTNGGFINLDNVSLASTDDLITNGDFQTILAQSSTKQPGPTWIVSNCATCQSILIRVSLNDYFFNAQGSSVILSQTVAINTVGQEFLYRLQFSVDFNCGTSSCSFSVELTTT